MNEDIRVYARGLAFSPTGEYDLRVLETLISSYRKILDRLVTVQLGRRHVPKELRSQLGYNVRIEPGSIELFIKFLLEHKEVLAVFAADGGYTLAEVLVKLLGDAIDLRKAASEFLKKGLAVNINISNSFNFASQINDRRVVIDHNAGSIVINDPKILWAAQLTRSPVNELLQHVDGKVVEYVDFGAKENELRLTSEDRQIIGQHKEELPTTMNIIGRLDMVAFSSHRGSVISDNERFSVTWDDTIRSKMQRIADVEGVVFKVRPVVDHKRLDNSAIAFHVLDCRDPQEKMFG